MTRDVFWKQYSTLSPTSKKLVEELVSALGSTTVASMPPVSTAKKRPRRLTVQPFFGMWKDRDDMKDGSTWVRELRRSQWKRTRD